MFFDSNLFWFLMGIIFVLIAAGFKVYADEKGWVISWWKALLAFIWYLIFTMSFYAYGVLMGENEGSAGFKLLLLGLFICLIYGVGLWRLIAHKSSEPAPESE